ncbi:MAG: Lipoprotein signal peptidase [Chlamydiales bacterium]|nr:Lipoprotein signal peptidase [Chlamydiales bacterium]MCH9619249.1 Lipoprotein signal peptidase [Chlamydiales bacterium]MCH9622511.1 Lipoprotein signal peptidase [Chlamydiales bacterium]
MSRIFWMLLLGLPLLFVDFASKWAVFNHLKQAVPVFQNFLGIDFAISLTFNRGAAWGLFSDFQVPLLVIRMAVIVGLLVYLVRNKDHRLFLPLVLISFGAIGNVMDFFLYGFVIDFLQFNFWGYHFPLFNIADTAISVGVIWLFILSTFLKKHEHSQIDQTSASD